MTEALQTSRPVEGPLEPSVSPLIPARALTFEKPAAWRAPALSAFVKQHHYSKACPPGMHWFSAWHGAELVGVMLFRKPSLPKTGAAYGCDLELSRVVLLDKAGKNSESRFIGWALRWLKKHTDKQAVISFADPRFGHVGTIYKASNWHYLGREKGHGTRRIVVDGEWLHSKTAYDRWGMSGANLIAHLAPRKVEVVVCPPKNVYRYALRANVAGNRLAEGKSELTGLLGGPTRSEKD